MGTDIIANSLRGRGLLEPERMSDAQVEELIPRDARAALIRGGLMAESASAGDLRQMLVRMNADFRDKAPLSAADAATIILDGVRSGAWRILVGEDAKMLDALVRAKPEAAYDYAELARSVSPPVTETSDSLSGGTADAGAASGGAAAAGAAAAGAGTAGAAAAAGLGSVSPFLTCGAATPRLASRYFCRRLCGRVGSQVTLQARASRIAASRISCSIPLTALVAAARRPAPVTPSAAATVTRLVHTLVVPLLFAAARYSRPPVATAMTSTTRAGGHRHARPIRVG